MVPVEIHVLNLCADMYVIPSQRRRLVHAYENKQTCKIMLQIRTNVRPAGLNA